MMIDTNKHRLEAAIAFAAEAHAGQVYKGLGGHADEPYVMHPLRVMMRMTSPMSRVVAVLHDCLEDAGKLPDWLLDDERDALRLLTRDKGRVTYAEYIQAIADAPGVAGFVAREVKVADLLENLSRTPPRRLSKRYKEALAALATARPDDSGNAWGEEHNLGPYQQ